jgi:putative transposase
MLKTFQFRLRPNSTQEAMLQRVLEDNCETANACIQERRDAWKLQQKSITYYDQQKELTELRKDPAFQWIACDIQRDPLRRVDRAFKAFFRRCKAGEKKVGFPRFRSRYRYDSFTFSLPVCREKSIKIPNVGDIRARGGRTIEGRAKACSIKRDGKRWTASVVCDIGEVPAKCVVSNPVGIDVGLTSLATLSDETVIANPRWTKQHEVRIANAGRSLARKKRGSKNRIKAREVLRRAHQRAANARLNYIHHASKWLVANYDLIAFEDLQISNMARSAKGTVEEPGSNVKQKAGLNRSIMDAAWGILIWQLTYKAEKAGRWAVPVNPRGTSQKCSGCGAVVKKKLSERTHSCSCGLVLGRDHNAGINIKQLALSSLGMSDVVFQAESMQTSKGKLCI